ncbi:AAA family ATPase [Tumebacillus sp. ITR2]|uniref:AAA family ATPase n=1 Tax=Tumebacillus amylolyticus TaxID=2801339 RepID=A0ABS1J5Y2_9BACL|nr:AAA family ATPase [Tumebacillus amylolyticus]MBL0385681.1 AAA family ATPase [Tumebacillus amylolyticus]
MSDETQQNYSDSELKLFHRIDKALQRKGQVILYGPPGTGKTYMAKKFVDWKLSKTVIASAIFYLGDKEGHGGIFNENGIGKFNLLNNSRYNFEEKQLVFINEYNDDRILCVGIGEVDSLSLDKNRLTISHVLFLKNKVDISDVYTGKNINFGTVKYYSGKVSDENLQKIKNKLDKSEEWEAISLLQPLCICTFHPSYTYEDFIEGYKPKEMITESENVGVVSFHLESGILKRFVDNMKFSFPRYFIIDELNRGNVPKIFGELITIMEKDKRGEEVLLPYSKKGFFVPNNLNIIGTMNTSDRSIKMMDAALKRRFAFIEVMPDYSLFKTKIDELDLTPGQILQKLNVYLMEKGLGRDKQIGQAYFMQDGKQVTSVEEIRDIFDMDIIPLIQEYCYDDYNDLADIVGAGLVNATEEMINREPFDNVDLTLFINSIRTHFGDGS